MTPVYKELFLSLNCYRKTACSKWCTVKLNSGPLSSRPSECFGAIFHVDHLSTSVFHRSSENNKLFHAAPLDCAFILLHFGQWSHLSFNRAEVKIHDVKKKPKTQEWAVFTHLSDHVQLCVWSLGGCTVFLFCRSGHTYTQTNTHIMVLPLSFLFCCRHRRMWLYADMSTDTEAHTHTPLAMYHGGLPCCLSNQRMGSFQLHWSEHVIPFPSTPLLNTQTHKYMTYIRMHTLAHAHTPPSHSLTSRAPAPHSKSERLMWFFGQNEIVCHY